MNNKQKYRNFAVNNIKLWLRTVKLVMAVVPSWTAIWIILLILLGLIPGATVYFTKLTIDSFILTRDDFSLLNHSLLLLGITGFTLILSEILRFFMDWVRAIQADILTEHLKDLIQQKATEVDIEFYESAVYYDLLEQVRSNSISKPLELIESFGSVFQSTITLLTFSTLMITYGWWVPLLLLFGALPALYIYIRSERRMHRWIKASAPDRRWLSYLESAVTTDQTAAEIRVFNLGHHFREKYRILSLRLRRERMRHVRRRFGGRMIASLLALCTAAAAIGWMALRVLQNTATLGDLAVFYQVFSRGQSLTQSLLGGINQAFSSSLYLENLFEFLDLQPKIRSQSDPVIFPAALQSGIRYKNVTFTYPGSTQPALTNFNLFIPAGKIVAVVGINGAGKSTLVKLLCRFYDPEHGSIEIDGIDIRQFDVAELRKNLSLQFQFPVNYHETARQNITFGDLDREYAPAEMQLAAEAAGAHDFISKLPENYETPLGRHFAEGWELSGGQWQRLTMARAYYRKAQIMILDEPTSFMDSWSEADWFDHLRALLVNRTGLVITHRFTIAMRADIIKVVGNDGIIESGTHHELLESDGFYAQSWKAQMQASFNPQSI